MIGNVLTLKQLEALVWVAELGSFRKAAQHLGTTQPNISSRIAGLEKTLDVVLMRRDAGSVVLTDKGAEILAAAHDTLRTAERIVEIAQRRDLVTDKLRLGVTELVACTWLHAYLRRIKAAYPALNVELTVDLSRNLDSELRANHLDLAIQTAPFTTPTSGTIALGDFAYAWVAAPEFGDALRGKVTVADLLPYSILTHARHTQAYVELVEHAQDCGLPTAHFMSSSSMASCVQMAADGMGVTLLPKALVAPEVARGALINVDVDWLPTPLQFAARYQSETAALHLDRCAHLALQTVAEFHQAAAQDKYLRSPRYI